MSLFRNPSLTAAIAAASLGAFTIFESRIPDAPQPHVYRRSKGGKQARGASGAAAIKRAARKRRNIRARASKRVAK